MTIITEFRSLAQRAWARKLSLMVSFWGVLVAGNLINAVILGTLIGIFAIPFSIAGWIDINEPWLELVMSVLVAPFFFWSSMVVWRCAFNTSWKGWAYITRVFIFYCYGSGVASLIAKLPHY